MQAKKSPISDRAFRIMVRDGIEPFDVGCMNAGVCGCGCFVMPLKMPLNLKVPPFRVSENSSFLSLGYVLLLLAYPGQKVFCLFKTLVLTSQLGPIAEQLVLSMYFCRVGHCGRS